MIARLHRWLVDLSAWECFVGIFAVLGWAIALLLALA